MCYTTEYHIHVNNDPNQPETVIMSQVYLL